MKMLLLADGIGVGAGGEVQVLVLEVFFGPTRARSVLAGSHVIRWKDPAS